MVALTYFSSTNFFSKYDDTIHCSKFQKIGHGSVMKKMKKQLITILIILTILCSATTVKEAYSDTVAPTKLKIYVGPTSVLADNSTYNCIFVQLQDSSNKPTRAAEDTVISLSSSQTNIGSVDPSITILKGQSYASANFYATFSPGITVVAAAATGFATVTAQITTVGPVPNTVAVYGFPSTLPADGNQYAAIMVQLQDSSGTPAKAPKDGVPVTLSCSDTLNVGAVSPTVIIPEGKTYAIANFTTTQVAQTQGKILSATVTALSQGYASKTVTITTTPITPNPNQLKIYTGPTQVLADQGSYKQIVVELQNATGFVGKVLSDVDVTVASSDQTIGVVDQQLTIPQSEGYAVATLTTTYKAGSTTLTAVATDLLRSQLSITTVGFTPSKLAVYCVPSILPSDSTTYPAIQVQLQDSQGRPAKDPQSDVTISLFSSQPTVGTVSPTLTIPFGSTQATGTLTVTNAPGTNTITAQASSYTTGQATITTYLIDLSPTQITLTADPEAVNNSGKSQITAYITADGTPVTGATTKFTSNNGGAFTTVIDQGNGYYTTNYTAPSFTKTTVCTITASVSKTGYVDSLSTVDVTVAPPSASIAPTPTPSGTPLSNSSQTSNTTSVTNTTGTLKLLITDGDGNPLCNASISSTVQPAGMDTLIGVTNETGYAIFDNATQGSYTFSIVKEGIDQVNKTINFKGQPLTYIAVSGGTAPSTDNTLPIVVVIIVAVVIAVIFGVFVIKRRGNRKPKLFEPPSKSPSASSTNGSTLPF
jgi:hypothetical protein